MCATKGAIEKKEEKIANLDESFMQELAADEINKERQEKQKAAKRKAKAGNKALQRIAAEKKKFTTKQNDQVEEEEEEEDISTFAKSNRGTKKRN